MRRAALVSLAVLGAACVLGSAAGAAGTRWHVTSVGSLGKGIGTAQAAAVNRSGTSVVAFASRNSLTVVRRTVHGPRFTVAGRISVRNTLDASLTALADGRFLLVYVSAGHLLARNLDSAGRFLGPPHLLATGYTQNGPVGDFWSLVAVASDASRAVVVWGPVHGLTYRVEGAIDSRAGWSRTQLLYSVSPVSGGPLDVQAAGDSEDSFVVSVQGTNGDTADVVWALARGSGHWAKVTPPQVADRSPYASVSGMPLASLDGTITAAWQDVSGAVVVSTWDGSTWSTPVTAIAARHASDGLPVAVDPVFVSDGSRAALVWADSSMGPLGPLEATIRAEPGGGWSAPLVFPHSRGGDYWPPFHSTIDTFWFTPSGALAGAWEGDPLGHGRGVCTWGA